MATRSNKLRVLHIEDDQMMVSLLRFLLEKEGFEVCSRPSGASGIEALYEILPNVVLLDIKMPLMDGFEVLQAMRAHSALRERPVICLTAMTARKEVEQAISMGVEGYFFKPANLTHLLNLIKCFALDPKQRVEALLSEEDYARVAEEARGRVETLLELDIVSVLGRAGGAAMSIDRVARLSDAEPGEVKKALDSLQSAGLVERVGGDVEYAPSKEAVKDGSWNRLLEVATDQDLRVVLINLICAGVLGRGE